MARMGQDGYSSAGSTQISAKVPEPLKEEFREACDERGESMTDVIEQKMKEVVDNGDEESDALPDDDRLRAGYQCLRAESDPDTGRIDTDVAESAVAEKTRVKSRTVRQNVLDPLERRGYISYCWGSIKVRDPEDVEEITGTA